MVKSISETEKNRYKFCNIKFLDHSNIIQLSQISHPPKVDSFAMHH